MWTFTQPYCRSHVVVSTQYESEAISHHVPVAAPAIGTLYAKGNVQRPQESCCSGRCGCTCHPQPCHRPRPSPHFAVFGFQLEKTKVSWKKPYVILLLTTNMKRIHSSILKQERQTERGAFFPRRRVDRTNLPERTNLVSIYFPSLHEPSVSRSFDEQRCDDTDPSERSLASNELKLWKVSHRESWHVGSLITPKSSHTRN